jgi:hypothetical protein
MFSVQNLNCSPSSSATLNINFEVNAYVLNYFFFRLLYLTMDPNTTSLLDHILNEKKLVRDVTLVFSAYTYNICTGIAAVT